MAGPDSLDRECDVLHRYLTGRPPDGYTAATYRLGHTALTALQAPGDWFDRLLLWAGCLNPVTMRLVQAYSRLFAPATLLCRKAVLLLAIIECNPATVDCVQPAGLPNRARLVGATVGAVAAFALALIAGFILLAPLHVVAVVRSRLVARPEPVRRVAGKGT